MSIRVTGPDPAYTRMPRSMDWARERARRVALLAGSAEIQRREHGGDWQIVETWQRVGSRVSRVEGAK